MASVVGMPLFWVGTSAFLYTQSTRALLRKYGVLPAEPIRQRSESEESANDRQSTEVEVTNELPRTLGREREHGRTSEQSRMAS